MLPTANTSLLLSLSSYLLSFWFSKAPPYSSFPSSCRFLKVPSLTYFIFTGESCLVGYLLQYLFFVQFDTDLDTLKEGKRCTGLFSQALFSKSIACVLRAVERVNNVKEWRVRTLSPPFLQLVTFTIRYGTERRIPISLICSSVR